jgi:hypothetical protein
MARIAVFCRPFYRLASPPHDLTALGSRRVLEKSDDLPKRKRATTRGVALDHRVAHVFGLETDDEIRLRERFRPDESRSVAGQIDRAKLRELESLW